jgi:hypothetical protein
MPQRLQQAVSIADWGNEVMLSRLAKKLDRELPGVEAFVIDDTGFGKKGNHWVYAATAHGARASGAAMLDSRGRRLVAIADQAGLSAQALCISGIVIGCLGDRDRSVAT